MIPLHVSVTEIGGPRDQKDELVSAINFGLRVAIEQDYYRKFLPKHFTPNAVSRYGYEKRTKKYQIRKARKRHHQNPLVWSGALQRELTRSLELKTLRKSSGASGKMRGRALRFSGRYNIPDMKAEVIATVPDEVRQMAITAGRVAVRQLKRVRRVRKEKLS